MQLFDLIERSHCPLLIIGNGARGANIERLLETIAIPVVSSWGGADILRNDHPLYIGRMGIFGDRASNYAAQNADLIIALGTRLSVAQIGHAAELFAPNAKKIVVDIDESELNKPTVTPDLTILGKSVSFVEQLSKLFGQWPQWSVKLQWPQWSVKLQTMAAQPEPRPVLQNGVDAYHFVAQLNKHMADDAVVVTDVGIAYIATMQTLRLNGRQRLFHSGGVSAMGYGLPAAIGAYRAGKRQTICIAGDGGMMVNLQELQTIAHHRLPIAIFVFANNGYATIRIAQDNHFGRHSISSPETGLSCPDFAEIAKAFGIPTFSMFSNFEVDQWMEFVTTRQHPILCVVHISPDQKIIPRVQSRMENGKFVPVPLDQMWPPAMAMV